MKRLRRRVVPYPRCTIQITLVARKKKRQGKITFWWPDRVWNLEKTVRTFLDGAKFGAEYVRAANKKAEKRQRVSRAFVIRNPR